MTSPITPEERAEKLHGDLCVASFGWACKTHHGKALIAQALREAEDAAYERAAQRVWEAVDEEWGWAGVEAILELKSPQKDQGHE